MVQIVGIGANVHDTIYRLGEFPQEDTKQQAVSVTECGGGPCSTGLVAAAKLGASCAYIGNISDGAIGTFLKNDLAHYGVDTSMMSTVSNTQSFRSCIWLADNTASRTCIYHRGNVPGTVLGQREIDAIKNAEILMVDGNDLEAAIAAAQIANQSGATVLYDAGGLYNGVEKLLELTDILIPSEDFARQHTGKLYAEDAALCLKESGGTVTVLTMGPTKLEVPLKELLARGVDRAILISDPALAGSDTYATAKVLAAAIQKLGNFDLILCGNQSVDGETGQVPPMLAAALKQPCITNVEKLTLNFHRLNLERVLEDGIAELSVQLPCVVSIRPYAYTLRLPGILALRKAQATPVQILNIQDLGLTPDLCGVFGSLTKVSEIQKQFHTRRNGPKETDPNIGCNRILRYLQEVK